MMKALSILLVTYKLKLLKYFDNGSKNMSFFIKDDELWDKYDKI